MYLMLDVPNITRRDSLIDPYCAPATRTQKVALKQAWARRNFKKRETRNVGDIFPSWKRACSGGKAWHTVSQIQTIWTVHCFDYFLTNVDRRSHGTHSKGEHRGTRGLAFVSENFSELLVTLVALWRKRWRGARCVWNGCFVRRPRSVSLPSQGQLGVEPSASELNPKHLKERQRLNLLN